MEEEVVRRVEIVWKYPGESTVGTLLAS